MFLEKVAAAVFVTAFLPDCTNPRSHVIEKVRRCTLLAVGRGDS
jgi:hypothetical protein